MQFVDTEYMLVVVIYLHSKEIPSFSPRYSKPAYSLQCYSCGGYINCYLLIMYQYILKLSSMVSVLVRDIYVFALKIR